jgi:beta-glucosidase/6-phospho-beta-glucosidase/beta-galactosidase
VRRALLASLLLALATPGVAAARDFPKGFLWGPAIAAFQSEAGGHPANADRASDWWVWSHDPENIAEHRISGDRVERGPGHWRLYRRDATLARSRLGANAFRLSLEWSRLFPHSTGGARTPRQLDRLVDQQAARHYAAELRAIRARGMTPMVTLNHFTLPTWLHDPIAVRSAFADVGPDDPLPGVKRGGWLDERTVRQFGRFAAWAAWRYGRLVKLWATVNEPMVMAVNGYVNVAGAFAGWFPPGVYSFPAAILVVRHLAEANALAYDAVHRQDRHAQVGPVQNMVAFTPTNAASAADRRGARHADYIFNRVFLNAVVKGWVDGDVDGQITASERHRNLRGRADFIGVNYYFRGRVTGLPAPASSTVALFDFLPTFTYRYPLSPTAPPCPTTCTEFGAEIYPQGFRTVLREAGSYRLPIYVTENGLADTNDDQRAKYLVDHLRVLRGVMRAGLARVKGYFAWTLVDNFEWAAGYYPKFGFFSYDPDTLARHERASAAVFRRIARLGTLPAGH